MTPFLNEGAYVNGDAISDDNFPNDGFKKLLEGAGNPTVGRVVHYHSRGSADGVFKPAPRAAVITEVSGLTLAAGDDRWKVSASLVVLNPTGLFFDQGIPYSETPQPGHWSWPPRA